jgi:Glycosyl hydrolase family 59/Ricin-type beta-trefoil lectin domain
MKRRGVLFWRILAALGLIAGMLAAATVTAGPALAQTTTINANGASAGRTFGGIGAISGGGGNTRLLTDYPATEQNEILNYLFTPDYGASLQILKVEIGGDTNSTDGSESSIEHTEGNISCNNGYEWWLMEQAKDRNPNIKFYGLAWGAPGWVGTFWSTATIDYLVSWLNCATSHGLTISYLGGWNERSYDISWYEQLRTTLNDDGFSSVQIVADDTAGWDDASAIESNSTFANDVAILGAHYPCQGGDGGSATTCTSSSTAEATGKPLWASENGSQDYNSGAEAMIRSIIRGYTDGEISAYINWPIIASVYPDLPYDTDGLIWANQPWSGWYSVGAQLWTAAQVTQFTEPGWQFLNDGSGYLDGTESDGSYVTLKSTDGTDYSTIIETTTATAAQTVTEDVSGGLSTGEVHVWASDLAAGGPYMQNIENITPSSGSFSLTVEPGYVYSITTTTGQGVGTATGPAQSGFALPYSDNFSSDTVGQQPKYLSQMQGAFEVEACAGGLSGDCLQQQAATTPIEWDDGANPYTIGGNLSWGNYTVSAKAYMEQAGAVQLLGRVGTQTAFDPAEINDYYLQLSNTGAWSIIKNSTSGTETTLASGTVSAPGVDTWNTLSLTFNGSTITASINGTTVGSVTDSSYSSGMIGFGTDGYQTDQFADLSVTSVGSATPTGEVKAGDDLSDCMDDEGGSSTNGTHVEMYTCNNSTTSQQWTLESGVTTTGGTVEIDGSCLDITGANYTNGTDIELWTCNGGANQDWIAVNGTLVNPASGKCLDDPGFNTANLTQLDLWTCNGGSNQQWLVP